MSPEAGEMLLHEIVPRIASAVRVAVSAIGSEDREELVQDGTAMAAKILINAQRNGKKVTPGNVAYYTLQHLKSGRRFVGNSIADVLASGTRLNGRSTVYSADEEVPMDDDTGETVAVSELMSLDHEDPATLATRNLDWQEFLASQDKDGRQLLVFIAEGRDTSEIAGKLKLSRLAVRQCTDELREALMEFFGESLLRDLARVPQWFEDLHTVKECLACRSERSWQTH